jgi:hypothetical protein
MRQFPYCFIILVRVYDLDLREWLWLIRPTMACDL